VRCAEAEPRLGEPTVSRDADRQRDAEVREHRLAIGQQDVRGFDVAVNHALAVRVVERVGKARGHAHGLLHRKLVLAVEAVS